MLLRDTSKAKNTWELTRASVDGLVQAIESGHNEVFSSYLETMARFHTYSARNVLLIAAQRPKATRLEGVRSWNELGRFVRPGEKGIFIFAPTVGVKSNRTEPAESKKPAKGKKPAEETKEPAPPETQLLGFRGVYVFDVEQTGGEELAQSQQPVAVAEKLDKLLAFAESQQMKIEYSDRIAPAQATSYRGIIRLLPKMKPAEAFPVLLREVVSQMLYSIQRRTFVTRAVHQQEAKAAAFVVCEALGLESKAAFTDCQLYYGDSRLLLESLQVVHRIAAVILGAISPEGGAVQVRSGGAVMNITGVPAALTDLLISKKIPSLDAVDMSALLQHLFTRAKTPLRIEVAGIAYCQPDHPNALDVFLACTVPMAQKIAQRKAEKIFVYPSDWQLECMYGGAVSALLTMYQRHAPLSSMPDAFRRYLLRTLATGAVRDYFKRDENVKIGTVEDITTICGPTKPLHNTVEQDIITRELLEQVTNYQNLPACVRETLQCIAALGPEATLKGHAFTTSGDSSKWKRVRGQRPILDPNAISKARGISRGCVHRHLWEGRIVLRDVFNADGRLFLSR